MTLYAVDVRDTIVLRDGRPFQAGANLVRSLGAPWPSSIAGLARTRRGQNEKGQFIGDPEDLLKNVAVRGPWLASLNAVDPKQLNLYLPSPADAVWDKTTGDPAKYTRRQLVPRGTLPSGVLADSGLGALESIGFSAEASKNKATAGPEWWSWGELEQWLTNPAPLKEYSKGYEGDDAFVSRLPREVRTHVAIGEGTLTAKDGALFVTEALRLRVGDVDYRFAFACDEPAGVPALRSGLVMLGGERRPTYLAPFERASLPECPKAISDGTGERIRVILTTPCPFAGGAVPKEIAGAKVEAACVGRPQVVSGWDFAKNTPKPTRRLAPAGSVYWVRLPANQSRAEWLACVWFKSVAESEQDQRDGYGVAIVGGA